MKMVGGDSAGVVTAFCIININEVVVEQLSSQTSEYDEIDFEFLSWGTEQGSLIFYRPQEGKAIGSSGFTSASTLPRPITSTFSPFSLSPLSFDEIFFF
ncbi:hypothetical protein RJ641_020718 [Dillenia turbinata]|uniref:Uncharacterized protein n=1 Tax=Dillenia turbinata TaxID=194707 RepID=A0AAN8YWG8_9MAGN